MIRGIRGATTVEKDTEMEVIVAVEQLMAEIIRVNEIDPDMVASVFFLQRMRYALSFQPKPYVNLRVGHMCQ